MSSHPTRGLLCVRKKYRDLAFAELLHDWLVETSTNSVYSMSLYIRFKRKNQTVFLHVEPSTTFQQVKVRLGENFDMSPDNIMLWASDKVR